MKMESSVLESSALVLNRFYMPVRVVDIRRAMVLLYRECAEVISIEKSHYASYDFASWCALSQLASLDKQPGEDYLKAVGFEMLVPRILRLVRFDKMPQQSMQFNRKNLFARDGHRCQYCGKTEAAAKLSLDHVIPRSHGGPTNWENIVCCCLRCNGRKGGRTPKQANMELLAKPVRPKFSPAISSAVSEPRYESWKTFLPSAV